MQALPFLQCQDCPVQTSIILAKRWMVLANRKLRFHMGFNPKVISKFLGMLKVSRQTMCTSVVLLAAVAWISSVVLLAVVTPWISSIAGSSDPLD